MSKDKLTDYDSTTASNNTDVGGISVAEGMLPSGVNNSIRELTKQLGAFADGTDGIDVLSLADDDASHAIKLQAPSAVTADTTFTLPDGDGASGQTMITDGAGTLSWAAPYGNRNLIINPAMLVAQRGVSFSSNNSIDYTVDRWAIFSNGASTTTQESFAAGQTDVPNEPVKYLKWNISTYSSGDNLFQRVEDVRTGAGQAVTLSFYAKADSSITNRPRLIQNFGSGGSSEVVTVTSTNALTTSWQKFTITATLPSISGKTIGSSSYLELEALRFTDTFTGGVYIANVQLELSSTATDFEHPRSFGDELARCQRYYQEIGHYRHLAQGARWTTNQVFVTYNLASNMRATPSATATGVPNIARYDNGQQADATSLVAVNGIAENTTKAANVTIIWAAGYDPTASLHYVYSNTNGDLVALDAEL